MGFSEIYAPDLLSIRMDWLSKSLTRTFTILVYLLVVVEILNIFEINMCSWMERKTVISLEANMYSRRDIGKSVFS